MEATWLQELVRAMPANDQQGTPRRPSGSRPVRSQTGGDTAHAKARRSCYCLLRAEYGCSPPVRVMSPRQSTLGGTLRSAGDASPIEVRRTLDSSLMSGIAWNAGAKSAGQLLRWAATLIVARILTPADYGLFGMATVFLGLVTLVSEFGLGSAVVALRDLSDEAIAQINSLSLLFGVAAFAASIGAAGPLGRFFHSPQLPPVIMVLAAGFLIGAFKTVPSALLERDLRFKTLALVDAGQALVLAAAMVAVALLGFGYWTLVFGELLSAALSTTAIVAVRRHAFAWPRPRTLGPALTFSAHLIGSRLCWYLTSNADFAVAGRLLGKAALGAYSFAWTIAEVPLDRICALVTRVTPAVFSAVQRDHAALRRYVLRITEGLALLAWPAGFGMALVARDLVLVVLGDQWRATVGPLQVLGVSAALRSVIPIVPQVLFIVGESRRAFRYGVLGVLIMPVSFWLLGRHWGATGIAAAWLLASPLLTIPVLWLVFRRIHLPVRAYFQALWPALSACVLMSAGVLGLQRVLDLHWAPLPRLVVTALAGAAIYALACLVFHRARIEAFYRFLRDARSLERRKSSLLEQAPGGEGQLPPSNPGPREAQ